MGRRTLFVGLGVFALGLMLTVGCGPGGPKREPTFLVKGKLTNAGKPLPDSPNFPGKKEGRVQVRFIRESGGPAGQPSVSASASAEPDGTFELRIPKGKYRIGVQQTYAPPASQGLLGKFSERNSPIVQEVTAEGQEFDLDLSKVDVSKVDVSKVVGKPKGP